MNKECLRVKWGNLNSRLSIPTIADFSDDIDLFSIIKTGDYIEMDGDTGEVVIWDNTNK